MAVVIETNLGDFTVDLYTKERPQTCRNFLKLCKIKYYNFNLFLNVQSNFIAQTGDPTATGKGGQSVYGIILGEEARFYEAEKMPKIRHEKSGLLSMVNCGNNMLGSQFLITLAPELQSLDGQHCVFGEITEGLEIILKLNETICDADHRPYQDIRISHTVILEDPYEDPQGLIVPDRSPEPTKEILMTDRIGADEDIDDTEGLTAEQIAEMHKEKEAKARATILEIVGDIPDADIAPPENVLFVCKLNPVTNDDDLEIIFSRFGKIVGCEVIRDRQTGDSLQYAFIEFADKKSCEEAYFKMDNVLIDDRRIHVDFSQSVSKMRWRGKGRGIQYFNDDSKNDKQPEKRHHRNSDNHSKKRRSRSHSPRNRLENYNSKNDRTNEYARDRNGESRKRDEREQEPSRKRRDRVKSRSRSKDRARERRKRSRSRSREREKGRRNGSRETSTEKSSKKKDKEDNYNDGKKSKSRDDRRRGNYRENERDDKYSHSQRRRKSREKSEERYDRKTHKHKHKTRDR